MPYPFRPITELNFNALLSMIFSLVGIFTLIFTIPGIVLGFVALGQMKREPFRYHGKGMALAGIIVGFVILGLGLMYIFFIFFFIFSMPPFFPWGYRY